MSRIGHVFVPLLCTIASTAAAQTMHIVDAAGGGDYLTVNAAYAAAGDGDVLYVRGFHSTSFSTFEGKGVSVVVADGASFRFGALAVRSIPAGSRLHLHNVEFDDAVTFEDCEGAVSLSDVSGYPYLGYDPGAAVTFRRCASVNMVSSTLRVGSHRTHHLDVSVIAVYDSNVVLSNSQFLGLPGQHGDDDFGLCTSCWTNGTDGAIGMAVFGSSTVRATRSRFDGGVGGTFFGGNPGVPGWDAPPLSVDVSATVRLLDVQLFGPLPPVGPVEFIDDPARTVEVPESAVAGSTIRLDLTGTNADTAFLMVGEGLRFHDFGSTVGVLQVDGVHGRMRLGSLPLPGTRTVAVRTPAVPANEVRTFVVQAAFVEAHGQLRLSPARLLTIVGEGLPTW